MNTRRCDDERSRIASEQAVIVNGHTRHGGGGDNGAAWAGDVSTQMQSVISERVSEWSGEVTHSRTATPLERHGAQYGRFSDRCANSR